MIKYQETIEKKDWERERGGGKERKSDVRERDRNANEDDDFLEENNSIMVKLWTTLIIK